MAETVMGVYPKFVRSRKALGREPKTMLVYDLAVRQLSDFLQNEHGNDALALVDRTAIQEFLIEHMAQGRTKATANKTFRALRAFFNWMDAEEMIEKNPFKKLHAPPARSNPKNGYSVPEVKAQLASLREFFFTSGQEQFMALRDYAIFMVLYDTGLREGEVLKMDVEGIDRTNNEFEVKGKGGKKYRRHISAQTLAAIDRYIAIWDSTHINPLSGPLWRGRYGSRFTPSGMYKMAVTRAAAVGIKNASVHRWRYTHAEVLDELNWNEEMIMAEMGHSQRTISRHYRQASIRRQALKLHTERGPTTLLS